MFEFEAPDPYVVGMRAYSIGVHDGLDKIEGVPTDADGNKQRDYVGHQRDRQYGIGTHAAAGVIEFIHFSLLIADHLQLG